MPLIGELFAKLGIVDDFTSPLNNIQKSVSLTSDQFKNFMSTSEGLGNRLTITGAGVAGFGFAMTKLAPGLGDLGKMIELFGGATGAVGGFIRFIPMLEKYSELAVAMKGFGGALGFLKIGAISAAGSIGALVGALAPLLPVILGVSAVIFLLYSVWTENLGGIQDLVFEVFGLIQDIVGGVMNFLKGVIVGFFEATKPVWKALKVVVEGILFPFKALRDMMVKTGFGSFELGKIIGKIISVGFLPLKAVLWLLTPIFRLIGDVIGFVASAFGKLKDIAVDTIGRALQPLFAVLKPIYDYVMKIVDGVQFLIDWWSNLGKTTEEQSSLAGDSISEMADQTEKSVDKIGSLGGAFKISPTGAVTLAPAEMSPASSPTGVFEKTVGGTSESNFASNTKTNNVPINVSVGSISSDVDASNMARMIAMQVGSELERVA